MKPWRISGWAASFFMSACVVWAQETALFEVWKSQAGPAWNREEKLSPGEFPEFLADLYSVLKNKKPEELSQTFEKKDLQNLLEQVEKNSDALWKRDVPVWSYRKILQDALQGKTPRTPETASAEQAGNLEESTQRLSDLEKRLDALEKAFSDFQKVRENEQKQNDIQREAQKSELELLKRLADNLSVQLSSQEKKLTEALEKLDRASRNRIEEEQVLTILRKDLRDNIEDVALLKQKIEKLMQPEKRYGSPLDKALRSKWVSGVALLFSTAALSIALAQ